MDSGLERWSKRKTSSKGVGQRSIAEGRPPEDRPSGCGGISMINASACANATEQRIYRQGTARGAMLAVPVSMLPSQW